jgi:hypothetical protein
LLTAAASSVSAATCRKKITTFWGFEYYGQYDCYTLVGPSIPIVEIGQIIRECDDTTWSWGRTDCTNPEGITVEYEDCECQASLETEPSEHEARPAAASCRVASAAQVAEDQP